MEASELRNKTVDELRGELADLKRESLNMRFRRASGEFSNTVHIRKVRRDAARILTILAEKKRNSKSERDI